MIDAERYHKPEIARDLIDKAILKVGGKNGTIRAVALKVGVSPQYLSMLRNNRSKNMSYPLQVTLEALIKEYS